MTRPYQQPGLVLQAGGAASAALVSSLQRDLRALGYLRDGIDGSFGPGTTAAVRALQYDLLNNQGGSSNGDGAAPCAMTDFNSTGGAQIVTAVTGVVDQGLAQCIDSLLADPRIPQLPSAADPAAQNSKAMAAILASGDQLVPSPFVAAIARQESGGEHFRVPPPADSDSFIVVGLDHAQGPGTDAVTSRGYGIGQFTLFHHPPRAEEVQDFMLDPVRNVQSQRQLLRDKFDNFVVGKTPADSADDRMAEHPLLPLRLCRYGSSDPRYLSDCANCAAAAGKISIRPGDPVYPGAALRFAPTQYYASASYPGVPDRAGFLCDWPYAARRYNGTGINSYHYQVRILLNLLTLSGGS